MRRDLTRPWSLLGAGAWWLLALAVACGPGAASSTVRLAVEPTAGEQRMLDGRAVDWTSGVGPLEGALAVGGPRAPAELAAMVRELDATLGAIVRQVGADPSSRDPAARGRSLLAALFGAGGGRPLLQQYDADATTLYDVVTTGRFNCVSATMLYILAARRAGLDARPVLLPSHARALVVVRDRAFVVETTTANGFDPPASVSRDALDRARPKHAGSHVDLYADERGTEVDWSALLGIAYGNLGILARAHGDTSLAAALLDREVRLTPPAQAPLVRAQRVSLLTELATRALRARKFDEALALAGQADGAAPDARMKQLTAQNIAAIASQELTDEGEAMSEARLLGFAEPFRAYAGAYGDVRALSLTLVAERRLKRGDVDGSAAALHEASAVATSDDVRGQTGHNARLGELNRLGRLSATEPEAAWSQLRALGPPDPALGTMEQEVAQVMAQNRSVHFSNAGLCSNLEGVLTAPSPVVLHADSLRASCRARHALALSQRGDIAGAIDELRIAVRLEPREPQHRQNLAVMIEKEVDRLVHASGCKQAAPLVAEGRALDPGATFWAEATAFCSQQR